jgi:hypothetical protein
MIGEEQLDRVELLEKQSHLLFVMTNQGFQPVLLMSL